ncbi:MAG TPA: winged helix-turn-helix domain-containing protein [Roseiarcus sp.]|jgi:hypothetical protein|nr:winged helix-turn-helix domain-containing protein [Roseiarcus sp.]
MTRQELTALRDAIDVLLRCPDAIREQLLRWFAPGSSKPNGHDLHPPPPPRVQAEDPRPPPTPYVGKSKRGRPKTSTKTAERKLLAAMQDNPGLSVVALANAAGSSRSATGERLRQMALRGMVEKDLTGRWKLKAEEPRPPLQGAEAGPQLPPSN